MDAGGHRRMSCNSRVPDLTISSFNPGFRREHLDPFIRASGTFILPSDAAVELSPALSRLGPVRVPPRHQPWVRTVRNSARNRSIECFRLRWACGVSRAWVYLVICDVRPHLIDVRLSQSEAQRLMP